MKASSQALVIAHQGASSAHPSNTWEAFHAAAAQGADGIEFDVVLSGDGLPVISHDYAIGGRLIAEMSADALTEESRHRMPDLRDVLDWGTELGMHLLIEIKDPNVTPVLVDTLRRHDTGRTTLGSFHGRSLREAKAMNADLRTSLMVGSVLEVDDLVYLAAQYRCNGVHPCWEERAPLPSRLLSKGNLNRLRDRGLQVTLWHEEREEELVRLVDLRPDRICTNTPALLRRLLGSAP